MHDCDVGIGFNLDSHVAIVGAEPIDDDGEAVMHKRGGA